MTPPDHGLVGIVVLPSKQDGRRQSQTMVCLLSTRRCRSLAAMGTQPPSFRDSLIRAGRATYLTQSERGHTLIELTVVMALLGICMVAGVVSLASGVGTQEARGAAQSWQAAAAWAQVGVLWHGGSVALDYEDGALELAHDFSLCGGASAPLRRSWPLARMWRVGLPGEESGLPSAGRWPHPTAAARSTSTASGPATAWSCVRQAGSQSEASRRSSRERPCEQAVRTPDPVAVVPRVDPPRGHGSCGSREHLAWSACRSHDVRRNSGRPRTGAGKYPC